MFLTSFNIYFCLVMFLFLTSFNIYFCLVIGYACFMCSLYVLGLLSALFCLFFLRQGLASLVNLIACRRLVMTAENRKFQYYCYDDTCSQRTLRATRP